jgi:signal transduction histidine kinase
MSRSAAASGPAGSARPTPTDLGVALTALLLSVVLYTPGGGETGQGQVAASLVLSVAQALPLAFRRQRPRLVVTSVLIVALLHAVALGPVTPWPAWFALYALVRHVNPVRRAAQDTAAAVVGAIVVFAAGPALHGTGRAQLLLTLVVTAVSVLLAALVRTEQARLEALRERAASLERERDAAAREATTAERLRIARDVHDLVGHGLSSMAVQAATARLLLEAGQAESAQRHMAAVEGASRSAMREMRQLLGVLRDEGSGGRAPSPSALDIRTLVDQLRDGGLDVALTVQGTLEDVPASAGLATYRVVQESLTNAMKHAPGARVEVALRISDDQVRLDVRDDGGVRAAPGTTAEGHGVPGMRERVAALGGVLRAGPREDRDGWRVTATLPTEGTA